MLETLDERTEDAYPELHEIDNMSPRFSANIQGIAGESTTACPVEKEYLNGEEI